MDLRIKCKAEIIKLLEEDIGSTVFDICFGNIILDMSPQARETKAKNKQMGLFQMKNLLHSERKLSAKWKGHLQN